MVKRTDILLDDDNDLIITAKGDFDFGDADNQHVGLIFEAQKGEIRPKPNLGFGAMNYLKKIFKKRDFFRNLKVELEKDGYPDPDITVDFETGKLNIDIN